MYIVYIAFRFKRFSYFLQNVAMFYFVAFMIGGGLIAVRFFLQSDSQILNGMASLRTTGFGDPISWIFVIVGFPLLWYFSRGRLNTIEYRSISYEQMADVEIQIEDATIRLKGLIDSGNLLTDPITKVPVMIIDCRQTDRSYRLHELVSLNSMMETTNHPWNARIRMIPFRSVGYDQQMMIALRPDFINIYHDNKVYKVKRCLVGLTKQQFSSDGDFECILHPKMLIHTNAS